MKKKLGTMPLSNKGFTMIELLVVIVIIGILSLIVIPRFSGFTDRSKVASDLHSLSLLNTVTAAYAAEKTDSDVDVFAGIATDSERMNQLIQQKLLASAPVPQTKGVSFAWKTASQIWYLATSKFDFSKLTLSEFISNGALIPAKIGVTNNPSNTGNWTYNASKGVLKVTGSSDSRLFFENTKKDYTISTVATLSSGSSGGYGIFFDTKLNAGDVNANGTGYVFQFDRGMSNTTTGSNGAFVIQKRTYDANGNYKESRVSTVYTKDVLGINAANNPFWTKEQTIDLKVSDVNATTRKVQAYVGDQLVMEYQYASTIQTGDKMYAGLRGWGASNINTEFKSVEIQ
jgi:prepilin-type N-terminal cleavage/methylation domain-containing protein